MPGVKVERATVRTTLTPGAVPARLVLGRWQTGWEFPAPAIHGPAPANGAPSIPESERPRRRHIGEGGNPRASGFSSCPWAYPADRKSVV